MKIQYLLTSSIQKIWNQLIGKQKFQKSLIMIKKLLISAFSFQQWTQWDIVIY